MGDVGLPLTSLVQTVEEQWNGKDLVVPPPPHTEPSLPDYWIISTPGSSQMIILPQTHQPSKCLWGNLVSSTDSGPPVKWASLASPGHQLIPASQRQRAFLFFLTIGDDWGQKVVPLKRVRGTDGKDRAGDM